MAMRTKLTSGPRIGMKPTTRRIPGVWAEPSVRSISPGVTRVLGVLKKVLPTQ